MVETAVTPKRNQLEINIIIFWLYLVCRKNSRRVQPILHFLYIFYPTQNYCLNVRIKGGKEAILLAEKRHSILFVEDYFLLLFSALSVLRPM